MPLKGAIVGFGNVAINAHLPLWQENRDFEIRAVVESARERFDIIRDLLPGVRIYTDIHSMLCENGGIDFIDVCTPPCYHAEMICAACKSGVHVFCEKPLVTTFVDFKRIWQLAKDSQQVIFTVNNWKYASIWEKVLELIRENRIGAVEFVSLTVLRTSNSGGGASNWRKCPEVAGGGILLDHGCNLLKGRRCLFKRGCLLRSSFSKRLAGIRYLMGS